MKVKAVIKKVEKALGVKVSHPSGWDGKYCVSYGEHTLSWRSNSTSLFVGLMTTVTCKQITSRVPT